MDNVAQLECAYFILALLLTGMCASTVGVGAHVLSGAGDGESVLCQTYIWMMMLFGFFALLAFLVGVAFPHLAPGKWFACVPLALLIMGGIINYGGESCHSDGCSVYIMVSWWVMLLTIPTLVGVGIGCVCLLSNFETVATSMPSQLGA